MKIAVAVRLFSLGKKPTREPTSINSPMINPKKNHTVAKNKFQHGLRTGRIHGDQAGQGQGKGHPPVDFCDKTLLLFCDLGRGEGH